jgi:predicted ATPase
MRLRSLWLHSFKNLRDFSIDFSDSLTTVLVGPNGTGKSNVLEALIIIFRDLDLGHAPSLCYQLTYECAGATVKIDSDPNRHGRPITIEVDGERWSADRFSRRNGGQYLPGFVFGYYSGPSNRMQEHFDPHQQRFAADLREGVDRPLRPLLYARQVHSQFVLLSFFAGEGSESEILKRFLRIAELDSVLFVLKRPKWYNPQRAATAGKEGDVRFWGARGVVRDFVNRIYNIALAPLHRKRPEDRFYLYLADQAALLTLAAHYSGQAEFFKALESLYISDLIEDVRTRVKMINEGNSLTFRELSEGEQQLLTVLGLLRFIEGNEGLILLDEPDTHLNPAWSLEYIALLKQHVAAESSTQIVMATHDPLVVSGLLKEEVRHMRRNDSGYVFALVPDEDPRGMGVAGLLTSEIYGLRSQLDVATLDLLDEKRDLASRDKLTPVEAVRLNQINEELASLDFSRVTRDPLYKPYVDAISTLELKMGLRKAVLTPEEVESRSALASQVVHELLDRLTED